MEKKVWFPINHGLRGGVVYDEIKRPHVFMLTRAASDAYETLTAHDRMPVLIDQEI